VAISESVKDIRQSEGFLGSLFGILVELEVGGQEYADVFSCRSPSYHRKGEVVVLAMITGQTVLFGGLPEDLVS